MPIPTINLLVWSAVVVTHALIWHAAAARLGVRVFRISRLKTVMFFAADVVLSGITLAAFGLLIWPHIWR